MIRPTLQAAALATTLDPPPYTPTPRALSYHWTQSLIIAPCRWRPDWPPRSYPPPPPLLPKPNSSLLLQAAGLATMIAAMRPDIDNIDEYVRNTTARAFSVVASALGIPALLPFLKAVCQSKKSWQARHTGIKIVQQISILLGCAVLPHLKVPPPLFSYSRACCLLCLVCLHVLAALLHHIQAVLHLPTHPPGHWSPIAYVTRQHTSSFYPTPFPYPPFRLSSLKTLQATHSDCQAKQGSNTTTEHVKALMTWSLYLYRSKSIGLMRTLHPPCPNV